MNVRSEFKLSIRKLIWSNVYAYEKQMPIEQAFFSLQTVLGFYYITETVLPLFHPVVSVACHLF